MTRLCKSFCSNLSLIIGKDKLTKSILKALTNYSNTFTSIFATFCIFILAPASTFTLDLPNIYININLQRIIKLALKLFVKS